MCSYYRPRCPYIKPNNTDRAVTVTQERKSRYRHLSEGALKGKRRNKGRGFATFGPGPFVRHPSNGVTLGLRPGSHDGEKDLRGISARQERVIRIFGAICIRVQKCERPRNGPRIRPNRVQTIAAGLRPGVEKGFTRGSRDVQMRNTPSE